jgi:hypothetical protein
VLQAIQASTKVVLDMVDRFGTNNAFTFDIAFFNQPNA